MTTDDAARRERAAQRAKGMVIRKARLGQAEADFSPVRGAEAVSLATRLTVESFSLTRTSTAVSPRDRIEVRFVPRTRA